MDTKIKFRTLVKVYIGWEFLKGMHELVEPILLPKIVQVVKMCNESLQNDPDVSARVRNFTNTVTKMTVDDFESVKRPGMYL